MEETAYLGPTLGTAACREDTSARQPVLKGSAYLMKGDIGYRLGASSNMTVIVIQVQYS
jgi:hypothetical protein